MLDDEFKKLISCGESETVEFKKSTSMLKEGVETVVAFSNKQGGHLIFGINDNGHVVGQDVTDDTLKNIANTIKLNTDPKIYPTVECVTCEEKSCVLVTVEESPLKPHPANGRPYMRVGATNQKVDREQYELLLQQRFNGYGFDYQINKNATLDDISNEALNQFIEVANSVRQLNENFYLPVETILRKLDLLDDSGIKHAALLLFGKEPEKYYANHFEIKCGKFPSDDGYDVIENDKEYNGNIISNFHSALGFLIDLLPKRSEKHDVYRNECYEYPISVLRESIVNMIAHRDYRQNIKNTIELPPASLIFTNSGQLFAPTITIHKLKVHHPSRPGNKLIAKIFYMMGLFENWGSGTLKIISESTNSGKSSPEFAYSDGLFKLTLAR